MRKLLNRLLCPTGYRIERVSRFQRELDALSHRSSRPFKFVQIGANDGVRFDGLYAFVTTHPCSGVVVEPLPDMFERLRTNYADYPGIVPVNKAIHETAGTLPLFRVAPAAMARYPGWASGIASFDHGEVNRQYGFVQGSWLDPKLALFIAEELDLNTRPRSSSWSSCGYRTVASC